MADETSGSRESNTRAKVWLERIRAYVAEVNQQVDHDPTAAVVASMLAEYDRERRLCPICGKDGYREAFMGALADNTPIEVGAVWHCPDELDERHLNARRRGGS